MIFYLQVGVPDNVEGYAKSRAFLDSKPHLGCDVLREISAKTWKEARDGVLDIEKMTLEMQP